MEIPIRGKSLDIETKPRPCVSRPSYLYNGNPYAWKNSLDIETGRRTSNYSRDFRPSNSKDCCRVRNFLPPTFHGAEPQCYQAWGSCLCIASTGLQGQLRLNRNHFQSGFYRFQWVLWNFNSYIVGFVQGWRISSVLGMGILQCYT